MKGRPHKIPHDELRPKLTELRQQGMTCKGIARLLDYSAGHVSLMCSRWNIQKQLKSKLSMDSSRASVVEYAREHAPNANVPAVSEAKPDDTPYGVS